MLVLARFNGESIKLGNDIEVRVVDFRKQNGREQVRLGITAPKDVKILREELIDKECENE